MFATMESTRDMEALLLCEEEELIAMLAFNLLLKKRLRKRKRRHRWWVHPINRRRKQQGAYHNLVQELELDDDRFKEYFRLNKNQFAEVFSLVEADLVKHTRNREVIPPKERLALCLR